ncbi:MAG: peptide chain release factor 1 [Aurantimonas coralicida]|uniref:peptide chain release factor 1 n=1 Tax=Aurantimonas coralicida TaxID=182270 RepID=UPI001D191643|nr:peptide chain release factor 1 [Aurantimonas coralicida]MCC4298010.1 peptide chain release factor 1 [Aurantimonas coralicida]MDX1729563.1 peptide chain release factor 1 [Aurantimonas coralicida]
MATLPKSSLDEILNRFALLEHEMSKGPEHEVYTKLAAEYSGLEEVVAAIRTYQKAEQELAEARAILDEPAAGRDMRELAEIEIDELKERLETLTAQIRILLLPKDAADEKGAILEIRAGTGGSEAGLFAGDLFRMYQRYAEMNRWKVEIISASEGEVGGYREVIAAIRGVGVFSRLKFESGVHRVQRVPETESGGRIHTSAATVAVLPEAEDIDVEVKTEDIRIDTMRASGAGGQHVNTTDSAVRITHIPTGIVVTSSEKSQHQNRARAMQVLKARLFDMERQRADDERSAARKSQVGSGDRSERIRTYNFPQGRVTDHRINLTLYKLDRVIEGEMDELVDALVADHQAHLLAAVGVDA